MKYFQGGVCLFMTVSQKSYKEQEVQGAVQQMDLTEPGSQHHEVGLGLHEEQRICQQTLKKSHTLRSNCSVLHVLTTNIGVFITQLRNIEDDE